jgi:hypothetical protein
MKDEVPPADHEQDAYDDAWAEALRWAQREPTYTICDREYERIPFGDDHISNASPHSLCRDCGAAVGELHVPTCCWEQCPRCGGQAISCDCHSIC